MRHALISLCLLAFAACGGGGATAPTLAPASAGDPWGAVTAAIQAAQSQFPAGLCVEVATPSGVVYSRSFGGFTNQDSVLVASGSKWVSSTVILRLVNAGAFAHGLDTQAKELLVDANGKPWTGNMGDITLRQLLSFTSGISGDDAASDSLFITLDEAVRQIYADFAATASRPGSYFYYGSTHLRIAARMAEVATGKSWSQLFAEQLHDPMGWAGTSIYSNNGPNPNPAGGLKCTGLEYMRFLMMQLRHGMDGTQLFLPSPLIVAQRTDGYGPATTLAYSPFQEAAGWTYHYALGNWLETSDGTGTGTVVRYSSTGTFGWGPWVAADGKYGAIIMTKQAQGLILPTEHLKAQLDPLIRTALAQNPPVIRAVP
ncbi:serine hydrolase domain-containing protein [Geothrix sp.]|jgi:CubicO group peptidase (beta-lactamase class C family)|uniref:serine hydrolase domain-containing protein n=1 Tax=Geothrix sp. TaxID=1962974 RepID=UPI0025BB233A|nr:serine hydrolase domain-containing protein [Geothrix sp.]